MKDVTGAKGVKDVVKDVVILDKARKENKGKETCCHTKMIQHCVHYVIMGAIIYHLYSFIFIKVCPLNIKLCQKHVIIKGACISSYSCAFSSI